MSPTFSIHNPTDLVLTHPKHDCKGWLVYTSSCFKPPYFKHFFLCEFGVHVTRSINNRLSAFLNRISVVVVIVSKKQMIRIAAKSIIALMEHPKTGRNGTMRKKPSQAVRFLIFFETYIPNTHDSVTTSVDSLHFPCPARAKFWNMRRNWSVFINSIPKSFWHRIILKPFNPSQLLAFTDFYFKRLGLHFVDMWHSMKQVNLKTNELCENI